MHPELLSMSLFMFVTSCSPGPNNIVASYSGFNFGLIKTIPHMCGVIFGFSFSKTSSGSTSENPVKFIETFFFQFLNPKGVIVAIIVVSTYVESGKHFINYSLWVIVVAFFFACVSITFWTLLGKFLSKFATNEKFIKLFNYVMSILLLGCIATFYY